MEPQGCRLSTYGQTSSWSQTWAHNARAGKGKRERAHLLKTDPVEDLNGGGRGLVRQDEDGVEKDRRNLRGGGVEESSRPSFAAASESVPRHATMRTLRLSQRQMDTRPS